MVDPMRRQGQGGGGRRARIYRSRQLWDKALLKYPYNLQHHHNNNNSHNTRRNHHLAMAQAILYELQPIRATVILNVCSTAYNRLRQVDYVRLVQQFCQTLQQGWHMLLQLVQTVQQTLRQSTRQDVLFYTALIGYYYLVRYLHRVLDAGPLVVILSGLVLLWTVGLDDGDGNDNNKRVSAYSVFNRHCRAILGSIDVDSLVQQYAAGGGMMMMGGRVQEQDHPQAPRPPANQQNINNNNNEQPPRGSRKSGKRARRRNLELRRERRRQREAAAAMGFTGDGGVQEQMAMHRLLEQEHAEAEAEAEFHGEEEDVLLLEEQGEDAVGENDENDDEEEEEEEEVWEEYAHLLHPDEDNHEQEGNR